MAADQTSPADDLAAMFARQTQAMVDMLGTGSAEQTADWAQSAARLQALWLEFQGEQAMKALTAPPKLPNPAQWFETAQHWLTAMPGTQPEAQQKLWADGMALWEGVLGQFGVGASGGEAPALPLKDKRFKDDKWREQPYFALVHQTYLMFAEQIARMADTVAENAEGIDHAKREQLRFATRALVDALSPSNYPLTNPLVIERAMETRGGSLVKGMENLLADLRKGQLSHTDSTAFKLGENIAATPGKVVYQTPLFQLIQYSPTTDKVLETPLVIFPPWINRFYILDLNPQKSFVRWAVEQGITVFMVSWKSADASMADVVWDDYIAAQIEAIDTVRARLGVKAVHAIGYCVAGTTLAATLAVLARRDEADKVKSATFFTAQVDFSEAGDMLNFVDDQQIEVIGQLSPEGYFDGRYMAATFNLLRPNDLIWSYVVNNYLLGQDYPAFDMLHWNGDVTNLPVKWHQAYLRDLYRDNKLVEPDALSVLGTPIDLRMIETPCYIQAGREDHISPPNSVWKFSRIVSGPMTFLLAGSGHIAGVVNPPAANKYQYWTNDKPAHTLAEHVAGATEHPGSWWPHWIAWLRDQGARQVPATGKRAPGGKGDKAIEDAPGTYVRTR